MIRWMVRWIVQWITQTPIESGPSGAHPGGVAHVHQPLHLLLDEQEGQIRLHGRHGWEVRRWFCWCFWPHGLFWTTKRLHCCTFDYSPVKETSTLHLAWFHFIIFWALKVQPAYLIYFASSSPISRPGVPVSANSSLLQRRLPGDWTGCPDQSPSIRLALRYVQE